MSQTEPLRPIPYDDPRVSVEKAWWNYVTINENFLQIEPQEKISIIMTNYNHSDCILSVLNRIVQQKNLLPAIEVLIVDDDSNDDFRPNLIRSLEKFNSSTDTYIDIKAWMTHKNVTHNITLPFNIALKRANYDVIVNSPTDCWLLGPYLKIVSQYFTLFRQKKTRTAIFGKILTSKDDRLVKQTRNVTDVGLTAWKKDLMNIGGYNEKMIGWGGLEPDICGRLGISGVGMYYCNDLSIATDLGDFMQMIIGHDAPRVVNKVRDKYNQNPGDTAISNGKLSRECYESASFNPNGDKWGEIDSLERVI